MSEINFFTPIYYGSLAKTTKEKAIECIDSYFHFYGRRANVLPGRTEEGEEKVVFSDTKFSTKTLFKIIGIVLSYFTVIIPLAMLVSKALLRSSQRYKLVDLSNEVKNPPKIDPKPVDPNEPKQEIVEIKDLEKAKVEPLNEIQVDHPPVDPINDPKQDKIKRREKAKEELEKGLNISPTTIAKIQSLIPKILKMKEDIGIEYINDSKIFRLKEDPNFVFKMARSWSTINTYKDKRLTDAELMEKRFKNMIKAKEICLANNLGLLIIPHAKKFIFKIDSRRYCVLIVEESMDINPYESVQKEFYYKYSKELTETVRQLAIFIAKSKLSEVAQRHIPLINEPEDFHGPRRVALINLERMESAILGLANIIQGGLIGCVSEEQIDIVIDEAQKNGIEITDNRDEYSDWNLKYAKKNRLRAIESDKQLRQFYKNKGIVNGKEPIQVDIDSLGLDLTLEEQINASQEQDFFERQPVTLTMRQITEAVIKKINRSIEKKSDLESVEGKRHIDLGNNFTLEVPVGGVFYINDQKVMKLWIDRIIKVLVDKGHLFKLNEYSDRGYLIQA